MKCGTKSLHHLLAGHPRVFIPAREIHFFDVDDILQHNDFYFFDGMDWSYPSLRRNRDRYLDWYASFFADAQQHQLLGEDSTCYLASAKAAERIAQFAKPIKLIVILRDPTQRAYSHYWHLVRTGRATRSFEDTIRFESASVVSRSLYQSQIRNLLDHIPKDRLHVIAFEDFVSNVDVEVGKVCRFLGIDADLLNYTSNDIHRNKGRFPKYVRLRLSLNRLLRAEATRQYADHLIDVPAKTKDSSIFVRSVAKVHSWINPVTERKPPLRAETQRMLDDYFSTQNEGLSELVGINVDRNWYPTQQEA